MTDQLDEIQSEEIAGAPEPALNGGERKRQLLLLTIPALLIVLIAGWLLALRYLNDDDIEAVIDDDSAIVSGERPTSLDLGSFVALSDGRSAKVRFVIAPATTGLNDVEIVVEQLEGNDEVPVAAETISIASIADLDIVSTLNWESQQLNIAGQGWWAIDLPVQWADGATSATRLYFLSPDPNVNGNDAVITDPTDVNAEELFVRGIESWSTMQSVRYWQLISDGAGSAAPSLHEIDLTGSEPRYHIFVPGSMEAIGVGSSSWTRAGETEWESFDDYTWIPPSNWGEEYEGATGFQLADMQTLNDEQCQIISFAVPDAPGRVAAWYLWWVGVETGRVHREVMVSASHYMLYDFTAFDQPLGIEPPVASPSPLASPALASPEAE